MTQVNGRTPAAPKPNANPQQQQQQQQQQKGQTQKQVKQLTSPISSAMVKEGEKAKHVESHKGYSIFMKE